MEKLVPVRIDHCVSSQPVKIGKFSLTVCSTHLPVLRTVALKCSRVTKQKKLGS